LPADIRSRLASGLSLQLAPPGNAARIRIIRYASAALGRELSEEAASSLAEAGHGTATQLFGALFDVCATEAATTGSDATRAHRSFAARAAQRPTVLEIIAVVAKYTNVPQRQLKSGSRRQSIVFARAIAIYLARELSGAGYDQIGRALGGRDHTTIMHNYRKIIRELACDITTQETVSDLRRILLSR
jgi:chromosomal replication initiator protein